MSARSISCRFRNCGAHWRKPWPGHRFWTPPCDVRDLPNLVEMTRVTNLRPALYVVDNTVRAREQGEAMRPRFVQAVEHLSDVLARNDPTTREKIKIGWDQLKTIPLFIYDRPMSVQASDQALPAKPVLIEQQALWTDGPAQLHVWEDALPKPRIRLSRHRLSLPG